MIVGGYTLDLYCDTGNETPGTAKSPVLVEQHDWTSCGAASFYGAHKSDATDEAKDAGWTFKRGGFAYCPACSKGKAQ